MQTGKMSVPRGHFNFVLIKKFYDEFLNSICNSSGDFAFSRLFPNILIFIIFISCSEFLILQFCYLDLMIFCSNMMRLDPMISSAKWDKITGEEAEPQVT